MSQELSSACSDISKNSGVAQYTYLRNHIDSLEAWAKNPKTWERSKMLQSEYSAEKQKYIRSLFPGLEELIADSVKTWNSSNECEKLTSEIVTIYKATKRSEGNFIGPLDYNKIQQFSMFYLSLLNNNRKTVISHLTNEMFSSAECVFKDSEGNLHVGKTTDGELIGRVITMQSSSGATKTKDTVSIYIDMDCYKICRMYEDIKNWYFQGDKKKKVGFISFKII